MVVYNEANGEPYTGQRNLERMKSPTKPSMTVNFEFCSFEENEFSYAAIAAIRGRANVKSSLFRNNGTSRLGSVGATMKSDIHIASSCFVNNDALLDGIVMIDATSNITQNVHNFGEENNSIFGNCTAVFNDVSGTCAVDGNCQGACIPFTAESCDESISGVGRPIRETPPPVWAPTMEPELPPPPTSANRTANETTTSDSAGEKKASANFSPGAIFLVVASTLIAFCVLWACCIKGRKKGAAASGGEARRKGVRAPLFGGKSPNENTTQIKQEKKPYDEFDDYDKVLDDEYDDFFDDDGFEDESEPSSRKKKRAPRKSWLGRGVSYTVSAKKKLSKKKDRKIKKTKRKEGSKKNGSDEDDVSAGSSDSKGFQGDQEGDEEVGMVTSEAHTRTKKNRKKLQEAKTSRSEGPSVGEAADKPADNVMAESKGEAVLAELGSSTNSFNPFS